MRHLLLVLSLMLLPIAASAAPVVVGFTGVIDIVDDFLDELPSRITPGTPFTGTYSIDPDLATLDNTSFGMAAYDVPATVELEIAGSTIDQTFERVVLTAPRPALYFGWRISAGFGSTLGLADGDIYADIDFRSDFQHPLNTGGFYVNTALVGWNTATITIDIFNGTLPGTRELATGTITNVFVIPEPGTAILLGAGLAGFSLYRRPRSTFDS